MVKLLLLPVQFRLSMVVQCVLQLPVQFRGIRAIHRISCCLFSSGVGWRFSMFYCWLFSSGLHCACSMVLQLVYCCYWKFLDVSGAQPPF